MLFGPTSSRDIWGWGRISGVWAEAGRLHPRWTQVAEEMLLMFGRKPNQHDDMEERPSLEGHKLTCFLHPLGKIQIFVGDFCCLAYEPSHMRSKHHPTTKQVTR